MSELLAGTKLINQDSEELDAGEHLKGKVKHFFFFWRKNGKINISRSSDSTSRPVGVHHAVNSLQSSLDSSTRFARSIQNSRLFSCLAIVKTVISVNTSLSTWAPGLQFHLELQEFS